MEIRRCDLCAHFFQRGAWGYSRVSDALALSKKKKKKKVLREIHRLWWRQMCAQTRQGSEPRAEVLGFATLVNPL
jgi:hypothetical protein